MTDFNISTVSIRIEDALVKQLEVKFFIFPKDYKIGDIIEVEGRPDAFSILDPSDKTFINITRDTYDKKFRIYSWNDTRFSIVYDAEGNRL